jgi:hypothetical protein
MRGYWWYLVLAFMQYLGLQLAPLQKASDASSKAEHLLCREHIKGWAHFLCLFELFCLLVGCEFGIVSSAQEHWIAE